MQLARIRVDGKVVEAPELISATEACYQPYGTGEWSLSFNMIAYRCPNQTGEDRLWLRTLTDPASEVLFDLPGARFPVFVEGMPYVIFTAYPEGSQVAQIARMNLDGSNLQFMTTEPGHKTFPQMFFAPEYGEHVIASLRDWKMIQVYRQQEGTWEVYDTIHLPSSKHYVHSLRAFTYAGRSYLVAVTPEYLEGVGQELAGDADVWVTGIDSTDPFFRLVSDSTRSMVRKDPEVFIARRGPFILYSERDREGGKWRFRRAATGLRWDHGYDHPHLGGSWAGPHRDQRNSARSATPLAVSYGPGQAPSGSQALARGRGVLGVGGQLFSAFNNWAAGQRGIVAVDTYSGEERFRILGSEGFATNLRQSLLVDDEGNLYVPSSEYISKFDDNGNLLWSHPVRGLLTAPQLTRDGNLLGVTWNGFGYVIDADDGSALGEFTLRPWTKVGDDPSLCQRADGEAGRCGFVAVPAGNPTAQLLYQLYRRSDGVVSLHEIAYNEAGTAMRIQQVANLTGDAQHVPLPPMLSSDDTTLYVQDANRLLALDAGSLAQRWSFDLGYVPVKPAALMGDDRIVLGPAADPAADSPALSTVVDLGDRAEWYSRNHEIIPYSEPVVGSGDEIAVIARRGDDPSGPLSALVLDGGGQVLSETSWPYRELADVSGLKIREDGALVVTAPGPNHFFTLVAGD